MCGAVWATVLLKKVEIGLERLVMRVKLGVARLILLPDPEKNMMGDCCRLRQKGFELGSLLNDGVALVHETVPEVLIIFGGNVEVEGRSSHDSGGKV